MPKLKMNIKVEIKDKNGKVIKTLKKPCKSYVRQIIDILRIQMGQTTGYTLDTSKTSRNVGAQPNNLQVSQIANYDNYGIQVGIGTDTPTINDYKIGTLITHGSTSGKLLYGAVSVGAIAIVGSTAQFTIARTFTNNSGADITVKEVALAGAGYTWVFLFEHSLLEFIIANGESGTVTYTISVTV